jgi:hypothetical protein
VYLRTGVSSVFQGVSSETECTYAVLHGARREAMRFRKAMETSESEASSYAEENALLKERLEQLESEKVDVDSFLRRRYMLSPWPDKSIAPDVLLK